MAMKVAELKEELAACDEPEGLRQQGVAAPATARSDRAGPSCGAGRGGELGGSKGGAFTFLLYLARSEFRWEGGQLLAFCSEFVRRTLLAFCSKIAPLLAYPHPMQPRQRREGGKGADAASPEPPKMHGRRA